MKKAFFRAQSIPLYRNQPSARLVAVHHVSWMDGAVMRANDDTLIELQLANSEVVNAKAGELRRAFGFRREPIK